MTVLNQFASHDSPSRSTNMTRHPRRARYTLLWRPAAGPGRAACPATMLPAVIPPLPLKPGASWNGCGTVAPKVLASVDGIAVLNGLAADPATPNWLAFPALVDPNRFVGIRPLTGVAAAGAAAITGANHGPDGPVPGSLDGNASCEADALDCIGANGCPASAGGNPNWGASRMGWLTWLNKPRPAMPGLEAPAPS
jgi:hypothetical protein